MWKTRITSLMCRGGTPEGRRSSPKPWEVGQIQLNYELCYWIWVFVLIVMFLVVVFFLKVIEHFDPGYCNCWDESTLMRTFQHSDIQYIVFEERFPQDYSGHCLLYGNLATSFVQIVLNHRANGVSPFLAPINLARIWWFHSSNL